VGSGGAFGSLTNVGGAFAALNGLGATCDVTFGIVSDLSGETGANPINAVAAVSGFDPTAAACAR
jgi:hypothetical protein